MRRGTSGGQNAMAEKPETLATNHGTVRLPAFLPDATRAVVRSVDAEDLRRVGIQALTASTFHLAHRPGLGAVRAVGRLHAFMGWDGPILTDSGGFQVYSLLAESGKLGSITKKGFHYRLEPGADRTTLTPARCVQTQLALGADAAVCLDHCTHPSAPPDEQRRSVENTLRWARRCREEFDRLTADREDKPRLLAVVQGGADPDLRKRCAEELLGVGFDGYGFGGWPVDDEGALSEMVPLVADILRGRGLLWGLGIGKPEHIAAAAACGYDLFDCVLPTRDARHRRLYVWRDAPAGGERFYDRLYIQDARHRRDPSPVDATCDCPCCRTYSRAYLHHLFHIGDGLAARLATLHNLRFYTRIMESLRGKPCPAGIRDPRDEHALPG